MKPLFTYFGGKSKAAHLVWAALGDVPNYVEPFCGSAAVLVARPESATKQTETINDACGFVANFWRAVAMDGEAVARFADWPVNEVDLEARHLWLVKAGAGLRDRLGNPEFFDAKIAGWWVWGACAWIGYGWCSGDGPWTHDGDAWIKRDRKLPQLGDAGTGVNRQIPHLGDAGTGVNRKLPHLGHAGTGVNRKLPHLGHAGQGVNRQIQPPAGPFAAHIARLRGVRVACGDWARVLGDSVTTKHGLTGVFLDPPYPGDLGNAGVYANGDGSVFAEVVAWCREHGDNPKLRIVLAGHPGDADLPGWRAVEWTRARGYGASRAETLWLSPHCLLP